MAKQWDKTVFFWVKYCTARIHLDYRVKAIMERVLFLSYDITRLTGRANWWTPVPERCTASIHLDCRVETIMERVLLLSYDTAGLTGRAIWWTPVPENYTANIHLDLIAG